MKNKRSILLLTIVLIGLMVFYFGSSEISTRSLESVKVLSTDQFAITEHIDKDQNKDLSFFVSLANSGTLTELTSTELQQLKETPRYRITYALKSKSIEYTMNEIDDHLYLINKQDKVFLLDKSIIEEAMVNPYLDALYTHYQAPMVEVSLNQEPMVIDSAESQWNYIKLDNNWYTSHFPDILNKKQEPKLIRDSETPFNISFKTEPDDIKLQVFQDKTLLYERDLEDSTFLPLQKDGLLRYELTATWNPQNEIEYHGSAKYAFTIISDFPATLEFNKLAGQIGDYFKLQVNHLNTNETIHLEQSLLGSFQFTPVNGVNVGYLPVSYHTKAGTYPITFWIETDDGIKTDPITYDVVIENRDFKIQYLTISTTTEKATRNDEAYSQFAEFFTPTREMSASVQYWSQPFIKPVEGRTSTTYGERRHVNKAPTSYRHSGMDIAAPRGTPIKATNTGKVKLAMNLILTGNTVVIDHGLGVFSVYFHCDTLSVKEGQMVERGEEIATVGSTGFSTGPHLHWTMSIFDQNIEPEWIIDKNL